MKKVRWWHTLKMKEELSLISISDEPERKKMRVSDTSKVNYRHLKKEELIERLSNTQKEKSKAITLRPL